MKTIPTTTKIILKMIMIMGITMMMIIITVMSITILIIMIKIMFILTSIAERILG